MTAVIKSVVNESKWGFYPCDRETCLKLKEAHRILLKAYRDMKHFIRWDNKLPHNRQGERPKCPDIIEVGTHRLDKHGFYGRGFTRYRDRNYVQQNLYLHVLHQYQQARRPKPTPEEVELLDLPANLDEIIEELREFYEK